MADFDAIYDGADTAGDDYDPSDSVFSDFPMFFDDNDNPI